jgi:hypothetical protein
MVGGQPTSAFAWIEASVPLFVGAGRASRHLRGSVVVVLLGSGRAPGTGPGLWLVAAGTSLGGGSQAEGRHPRVTALGYATTFAPPSLLQGAMATPKMANVPVDTRRVVVGALAALKGGA